MSSGRLDRLSQLIGLKYGLVSSGSKKVDLAWIKRNLLDMVKNYIADPPVAYNIVPLLAQHFSDPFCKSLIENMVDLATNIKDSSPELLFEQIANISEMIKEEQNNKQEIRATIHSYYKKDKDREMAKNKFEAVVFEKLQNLLKQNGEELAKLHPEAGFDLSRLGLPTDRQPKELSKDEMWAWIHGHPAAGKYGLDDEDVFGKLYEDLELRHELTKLIYATNRARSPRQTANVQKAVADFMELARQKLTNQDAIESGVDMMQEQTRRELIKRKNDEIFENTKKFDPDPDFMAQQKKIQEETAKRQLQQKQEQEEIEADRERHISSEGSALLKALIKKRYL